jgi:glyoxylase-like metal-dependent hydrolase (beta-lactamase superfamily II)
MIGKLMTALAVLVIGFASFAGSAAADEVTIGTLPLTGQIYMLTGQGGNIGLFIGPDGTFLIDDQFAPLTEKILAAIKAVGGEQPKFLINTHYHGDHTGGNENLGRSGSLIFSHDNVRERLVSGSYLAAFKMKSSAAAPQGLPVVTFGEDLSFHLNGETVHAIHVPHAHTDGDSFIHFQSANVIHAGDIFFNGFYPFIDVPHGGSLKGMIQAVERILALADEQTKIIPGHGLLADKAQLTSYRQMLGVAYERLRELRVVGKTVEEAVAAKPLADLEGTWGGGLFSGDRWIELVYAGVY